MKKKDRTKVLRITQLGEPVLRRPSTPVANAQAHRIHQLIQNMLATMKKAKGVGIAAPQVGVGERLFIVAPEPSERYPHSPRMSPLAMINPRIRSRSKTFRTEWEGCLSIPGLRGRVPRHQWVDIEFTDRTSTQRRTRLSGFVARIFQHEFDHINGMVYIDRVRDTRTFVTEQQYRKRVSKKAPAKGDE